MDAAGEMRGASSFSAGIGVALSMVGSFSSTTCCLKGAPSKTRRISWSYLLTGRIPRRLPTPLLPHRGSVCRSPGRRGSCWLRFLASYSQVCPRGQARTIHTSHTLLRYLAQRRRIRTIAVPFAARSGSANMVGSRREGILEASHREDMGYEERRPRPALGRTGQPHETGHDDEAH